MRWAILGGVAAVVTVVALSVVPIAARPVQTKAPPVVIVSPVRSADLVFDADHAAHISDRLMGRAVHEYAFHAYRGQKISFDVESDLAHTFLISVLPPDIDTAMYTNFLDGNTEWQGVAPGDGIYRVRVAFLRSEARASGRADYGLDLTVR
jgi:hypothetical protein